MHKKDARSFPRIQCGNVQKVIFSLTDKLSQSETGYCICTDFSQSGAHFFTDREFQLQQQLFLTVHIENRVETIPVTVIRADTSLYDEERYCAAVLFEKPLGLFGKLSEIAKETDRSIAA